MALAGSAALMLTSTFTKPNHDVKFHSEDGSTIGSLDFNGPQFKFTGDADESAKVFVDWVMHYFDERLKQERERCIDVVARHGGSVEIEAAIRSLK